MPILLRVNTRRLLEIEASGIQFPKYGPEDAPEDDFVALTEQELLEILDGTGASMMSAGLVDSMEPAGPVHTEGLAT